MARIRKIIGAVSIVALIINLLLFAFRVYSDLVFWIIIVIFAIVAFPVMSFVKKKGY